MDAKGRTIVIFGTLIFSMAVPTALVVVPAYGVDATEATIERDQVIEHLAQRMSISVRGTPGLSTEEEERLLEQLKEEMRRIAVQVFPPTLSAPSQETLDQVLGTNFIISERDLSFNRVAIEEWLGTIKLHLAFAKVVQLPAKQQQEKLSANILTLSNGMKQSMQKHLGEYFSEREVDEHLNTVEEIYTKKIRSRLTYAFKIPIGDNEIRKLIAEFDKRLEESVPRVSRRLARAERIDQPGERKKVLGSIRRLILRRITSKPFTILADKTVDRELASIDPDELVPGYSDIVNKRWEMEKQLLQDRIRREEEAKEREEKERFHEELMTLPGAHDIFQDIEEILERDLLVKDDVGMAPEEEKRIISVEAKPEVAVAQTALPSSKWTIYVITGVAALVLLLAVVLLILRRKAGAGRKSKT